jgi:hypothetical protein
VQLEKIRERVQALQVEIAILRADNEKYLSKRFHLPMEMRDHLHREVRLQEILEELALLAKRKID